MTTEKLANLQETAREIERLRNVKAGLEANGLFLTLNAPVGQFTNGVYNTVGEKNEKLRQFWRVTIENFKKSVEMQLEELEKEFENA